MFWKQSYGILRKIFKYSRVIKWVDLAALLGWVTESLLYEHLPSAVSEKYRLASLNWSARTWVIIYLSLFVITLWEGVVRWYTRETLPVIGPAGSLQYEASLVAADFSRLIRDCIRSHGQYPLGPIGDQTVQQRQWQWEEQLSKEFRANLKERAKAVLTRLAAEGLERHDATQVLMEHSISIGKALDAAGIIFAMALSVPLNIAHRQATRT